MLQGVNAALIVDPACRQIIASAVDQTPVSTAAARNTLESFSPADGGGPIALTGNEVENFGKLFQAYTSDESTEALSSVSCLHPWRWPQQRPQDLSWHPLKHAPLVAIESSAARDRRLFPHHPQSGNSSNNGNELNPQPSISFPSKRQRTEDPQVRPPRSERAVIIFSQDPLLIQEEQVGDDSECCSPEVTRPYLCTGFDIYLAWEPCAMWVLHSPESWLIPAKNRRGWRTRPRTDVGFINL